MLIDARLGCDLLAFAAAIICMILCGCDQEKTTSKKRTRRLPGLTGHDGLKRIPLEFPKGWAEKFHKTNELRDADENALRRCRASSAAGPKPLPCGVFFAIVGRGVATAPSARLCAGTTCSRQ